MEKHIESLAKVASATMMAQSLSYCLERKNFVDIEKNNFYALHKAPTEDNTMHGVQWIKIEQVGRPLNDDSIASCFEALQNILHSCALPNTKLLFLIIGDGNTYNMYLGLRHSDANKLEDMIDGVKNFIDVSWAGIKSKVVDYNTEQPLKQYLSNQYSNAHCITGIPTLNLKNKYPGTIEYLMGGARGKKMAYLVVAEPIAEPNLDSILYQCRDMLGQAQSLKSFSFAESIQLGTSESISHAHSVFENWNESESSSAKNAKSLSGVTLLGGGLFLAAGLFFPPALGILPAVSTVADLAGTAGAAGQAVASLLGMGGFAGLNMLSGFVPTKTTGSSKGGGFSDTETKTSSESQSYSKTLTQNLVNSHIESVCEHLSVHSKRFEQGKAVGMWQVGCYLLTDQYDFSSELQLKAILSGEESIYEPIRIHNITNKLDKVNRHYYNGFIAPPLLRVCYSNNNLFQHPFGNNFSELKTVLTTKELSSLVNFPLHSVPGISVVDSTPDFSLNEQNIKQNINVLKIGKLLYGGTETPIDCHLSLDTLSRHTLVAGVNGSGKTNTVLSVLSEFQKQKTPFLVIEPAKTEYVDWAIEYNKGKAEKDQIKIFMPGCETYTYKGEKTKIKDKLRFNPFEVIWLDKDIEPRVLSHIDRVKSIFSAAFPMQDILPVIMENLIYFLYERRNYNWLDESLAPSDYRKNFPQLETMLGFVESVVEGLGYEKNITDNIKACMKTRINSLLKGWKKEMLNNERLVGMEWKDLFSKPCIINLSAAGDDVDRAFIMSLLLQFLYEYRIAEAETHGYSFNDNKCRHLVVVEEAHRIMAYCQNPELPQYKSGLMFSNLLSEVRAYGQGIMVVDQVPTRLIPDAIKNTNIKIIHKLVAADDAQIVSESMGLSEQQRKIISKLSTGQAIIAGLNSAEVSTVNNSDIYWTKINKTK